MSYVNWIELNAIQQLENIKELSKIRSQVIFKHSTRCAISSMALQRLERISPPDQIDFYFLDLLRYRSVSNKIAVEFYVHHQSPQILLIRNMECIYEESHGGIEMEEIVAQAK